MKDNKPLLFINSAQSNQVKDQNQYVYDSRFDKKNIKILKEQKREEKKVSKQKVEPEKEQEIKVQNEVKEPQDNSISETKSKKLMNKLELLHKRAKLGRYVLVSVETTSDVIEGYFTFLLDHSIVLSVEEEEKEIAIDDIKEIEILKV